MKPITPLGRKWEWTRSIWLIWLLGPIGFTSFISFFYIGIRAQQKKWMIAGFVYLFILVQFFIISENFPEDHLIYDLSIGLVLFGWVAAWGHALLARIEYLQIRALRVQSKNNSPAIRSEEIKPVQHTQNQSIQENPVKERDKNPQIININRATEEEISELPSVGPFLAKEIIAVREKIFQFTSYSHMVNALKIKPHVL